MTGYPSSSIFNSNCDEQTNISWCIHIVIRKVMNIVQTRKVVQIINPWLGQSVCHGSPYHSKLGTSTDWQPTSAPTSNGQYYRRSKVQGLSTSSDLWRIWFRTADEMTTQNMITLRHNKDCSGLGGASFVEDEALARETGYIKVCLLLVFCNLIPSSYCST